MSYTLKEFEEKMNDISPIELIEFTGVKIPIIWKCKICHNIYKKCCADDILKRTSLCH